MESAPSVLFHFEEIDLKIENPSALTQWIKDSIESENKELGSINYIFCSDQYLLKMNQDYLDHDTFTDIITFNYVEENIISGDLFISIERVKENSLTMELPFIAELKRVMIHGVLHLMGYDDKTPSETAQIRAKEDFYLTLSP